jgi:hypothetical protein
MINDPTLMWSYQCMRLIEPFEPFVNETKQLALLASVAGYVGVCNLVGDWIHNAAGQPEKFKSMPRLFTTAFEAELCEECGAQAVYPQPRGGIICRCCKHTFCY